MLSLIMGLIERRTKEGYKLRVHVDALRDVQNTTEEQWLQNWILGPDDSPFLPRSIWIAYLSLCIGVESVKVADGKRDIA